jgi:hypothetical protein
MIRLNPLFDQLKRKIRQLLGGPEDPEEYALVGAPVRPKLPTLSAHASVDLDE